jgi:hypothetical protein
MDSPAGDAPYVADGARERARGAVAAFAPVERAAARGGQHAARQLEPRTGARDRVEWIARVAAHGDQRGESLCSDRLRGARLLRVELKTDARNARRARHPPPRRDEEGTCGAHDHEGGTCAIGVLQHLAEEWRACATRSVRLASGRPAVAALYLASG